MAEVRTVWNRQMEEKYQEMQRQRDTAMLQNKMPISNWLANYINLNLSEDELFNKIMDEMIAQAEHLRDILKPFDGRE